MIESIVEKITIKSYNDERINNRKSDKDNRIADIKTKALFKEFKEYTHNETKRI